MKNVLVLILLILPDNGIRTESDNQYNSAAGRNAEDSG